MALVQDSGHLMEEMSTWAPAHWALSSLALYVAWSGLRICAVRSKAGLFPGWPSEGDVAGACEPGEQRVG